MYKNSFLYSCEKSIHPIFTKINRVPPTVTCNIHIKFELNRMYHLNAIVFTHIRTHTRTHTHTYITMKIAYMNSGDLKTYKSVKISKLIFFTITILSLHSICSESKKSEFFSRTTDI